MWWSGCASVSTKGELETTGIIGLGAVMDCEGRVVSEWSSGKIPDSVEIGKLLVCCTRDSLGGKWILYGYSNSLNVTFLDI